MSIWTTTATGLGSALNGAGFVPYVHGATLGTPSRGRPDRVLAAGKAPETVVERFERDLAAMRGPWPPVSRPAEDVCGGEL